MTVKKFDSLFEVEINRGRIEMFIQPQLSLRTGLVTDTELLVRWRNEDDKIISPNTFLPMIRKSNVKSKFVDWCISEAFDIAKKLSAIQFNGGVALNLDAIDLSDRVSKQFKIQQTRNPEINNVEVELTEIGAKVDRVNIEVVLAKLTSMGVSIAIDDFGTGLNNFDAIFNYTYDKLKVDRRFITLGKKERHAFFTSVVGVTSSLNKKLVVEGVETRQQAHELKSYGVELVQGYFFARPMTLSKFIHFYKESQTVHETSF